jgi:hypothetical protein
MTGIVTYKNYETNTYSYVSPAELSQIVDFQRLVQEEYINHYLHVVEHNFMESQDMSVSDLLNYTYYSSNSVYISRYTQLYVFESIQEAIAFVEYIEEVLNLVRNIVLKATEDESSRMYDIRINDETLDDINDIFDPNEFTEWEQLADYTYDPGDQEIIRVENWIDNFNMASETNLLRVPMYAPGDDENIGNDDNSRSILHLLNDYNVLLINRYNINLSYAITYDNNRNPRLLNVTYCESSNDLAKTVVETHFVLMPVIAELEYDDAINVIDEYVNDPANNDEQSDLIGPYYNINDSFLISLYDRTQGLVHVEDAFREQLFRRWEMLHIVPGSGVGFQ